MKKYKVQLKMGNAFTQEEKNQNIRTVEIEEDGDELINIKKAISGFVRNDRPLDSFDIIDRYDSTYTCFYVYNGVPSDDYMGTYKVQEA